MQGTRPMPRLIRVAPTRVMAESATFRSSLAHVLLDRRRRAEMSGDKQLEKNRTREEGE